MMISSLAAFSGAPPPLLDYLTQRFTYLSRDDWRDRIHGRRIFLNGAVSDDPDAPVKRGDTVAYDVPDFTEPPADVRYRVIYEDTWLLGVDKPGNLLVHKAGASFRSNLVFQLRYCNRPVCFPEINAVNRLDRETSGVVLFAKDKAVLTMINDALARRSMVKEYIAVVDGVPQEAAWTIRFPIAKDGASPLGCTYRVDPVNGKEAQTHVETVGRNGNGQAVLRVRPVTGRTHQIRVHLAACGLPIIGDKRYGTGRRPAACFPRQALHCASMSFCHPVTAVETTVRAPLPSDIQELLRTLGFSPCRLLDTASSPTI